MKFFLQLENTTTLHLAPWPVAITQVDYSVFLSFNAMPNNTSFDCGGFLPFNTAPQHVPHATTLNRLFQFVGNVAQVLKQSFLLQHMSL